MPEQQARAAESSGAAWQRGLGVLCAEAQADGVPCDELGKSCAECERAVADALPEEASHPNAVPGITEIAGP